MDALSAQEVPQQPSDQTSTSFCHIRTPLITEGSDANYANFMTLSYPIISFSWPRYKTVLKIE